MAMITCPKCGQEISDKAKKCIHCGRVLIEEEIPTKLCGECGKLNPADAIECLHCGCPIEENSKKANVLIPKSKKNMIKIITPIVAVVLLAIIGFAIYNVKVIKPKKIEAHNKATYEEAISLLEKGKYEDGKELLDTISEYEDVSTILEQIKWESRVYECITDIRQYLKNPDSLQVYEVAFYNGYKTDIDDAKKSAMDDLLKLTGGEAVCVMHRGGQNGFGGNTTGYSLFLYSESEGVYKYLGSCESLDKDEIDEDEQDEILICSLINIYKDNLETVGDVDLTRIKTIVKNDSYSTIKIIE